MKKDYNPAEIEKKWQKEWAEKDLYKADDNGQDKYYFLVEFPYPSGNLHVGHWYAFAVPDISARFHRMNGKNVLFPIGFDAFGLPAENAAIKRNLNPREWTLSNIDYMKNQLKSMGSSFDWSREVVTCDPRYYKWTQWLFLKLFEKGLAYQAESEVNWCPKDKTVLANEQVVNGTCERCGSVVEKKKMLQWNLKITDYADRLIDGLEHLDWPKPIKEAQKNWIGRSEGMVFAAPVKDTDIVIETFSAHFEAFCADTFVVIAPDHPLLPKLMEGMPNKNEILDFCKKILEKRTQNREEKESEGIFTGRSIVDPVGNGDLPIWVASYALADYGTGIVKCSAHDERDFQFAQKYNIPLKEVLIPKMTDERDPPKQGLETIERTAVQVVLINPKDKKVLVLKWKKLPWTTFITGGIDGNEDPVEAAKREVYEETGYKNIKFVRHLGRNESHFFATHKNENRKALFWNMLFELDDEEKDEPKAEEKDIHVAEWMTWEELNKDKGLKCSEYKMIVDRIFNPPHAFTDMENGVLTEPKEFAGRVAREARNEIIKYLEKNKLAKSKTTYRLRDWTVSRQRYWGVPIPVIHCNACGIVAISEKELPVTLPDIEDYLPRDDGKSPLSKVRDWVEVKCSKCGGRAERETDTLDTFVDSSWYFLRYVDPQNAKEFASPEKLKKWMPVDFYSGGAEHTTMHLLYSRFWHKALYDLGLVNENEPYIKRMNRGLIMGPDGQKMSKSRGNVIDPDKEVERLGADTLRMYLAFIGPYNEVGSYPWNPDSVVGVRRFLERVWRLADNKKFVENNPEIEYEKNKTILRVSQSIETMKLNTAVAALMIYVNTLTDYPEITRDEYETLLKLLSPFAPHIAEELWYKLGHTTSITMESWPEADQQKLKESQVKIVVQVNSRVRADYVTKLDASQEEIEEKIKVLPQLQKWLVGKQIKKVIYIPDKLINFVVS